MVPKVRYPRSGTGHTGTTPGRLGRGPLQRAGEWVGRVPSLVPIQCYSGTGHAWMHQEKGSGRGGHRANGAGRSAKNRETRSGLASGDLGKRGEGRGAPSKVAGT